MLFDTANWRIMSLAPSERGWDGAMGDRAEAAGIATRPKLSRMEHAGRDDARDGSMLGKRQAQWSC